MIEVVLFCSPLEEIPLHPKGPSTGDPFNNLDKILEPSPGSAETALFPCPTCGRTFLQKALERHSNICHKVSENGKNLQVVLNMETGWRNKDSKNILDNPIFPCRCNPSSLAKCSTFRISEWRATPWEPYQRALPRRRRRPKSRTSSSNAPIAEGNLVPR